MKFNYLSRRVHYWAAFAISAPLLVVIASGVLLQLKKNSHWIQPVENAGAGTSPTLSFDRLLEVCRGIPELEVGTWDDVKRIDLRPSKGMMKVWSKNSWEAQIDSGTGAVLQVAYRRSDLIESIHDGSWFHENVKLFIFLPAGVILFVLWITGLYLFALPYVVKRQRKAKLTGSP